MISVHRHNKFLNNRVTASSNYGLKFLNSSSNVLINNSIYGNEPYDYYSKYYSNNMISNTMFNDTILRFFDNSSNLILKNTDNRIVGNNKKIPSLAYPAYTNLMITPISKNVRVNTLDMIVIPSSSHISILSVTKNDNNAEKYLSWVQISPDAKISTKYFIGGLIPNTQYIVQSNGSLSAVRTTNSSGFISFIYDGKELVTEFKARSAVSALVQAWLLILIIVSLVAFFIVTNYRKGKKGRTLLQYTSTHSIA